MDNYIMINGVKLALTDEQIAKLTHKSNGAMSRGDRGDYYWMIAGHGAILEEVDDYGSQADNQYEIGNYFTDHEVAKQVSYREGLQRLLLRDSYSLGEQDRPWDGKTTHWYILVNPIDKTFDVSCHTNEKSQITYFPTESEAWEAIHDIVEPFIRTHEGFVW